MTGFWVGSLFGYLLGHFISDSIWKGLIEEKQEVEEWVEEVPQRHYKKKRRYS
jgi:membrane protein YqaA with SNARE-associated domain